MFTGAAVRGRAAWEGPRPDADLLRPRIAARNGQVWSLSKGQQEWMSGQASCGSIHGGSVQGTAG